MGVGTRRGHSQHRCHTEQDPPAMLASAGGHWKAPGSQAPRQCRSQEGMETRLVRDKETSALRAGDKPVPSKGRSHLGAMHTHWDTHFFCSLQEDLAGRGESCSEQGAGAMLQAGSGRLHSTADTKHRSAATQTQLLCRGIKRVCPPPCCSSKF